MRHQFGGFPHTFRKYFKFRFINNLLNNGEEADNLLCSPMNRELFIDQPQTLFVVCECDLLADQSTGKYVVRGY